MKRLDARAGSLFPTAQRQRPTFAKLLIARRAAISVIALDHHSK